MTEHEHRDVVISGNVIDLAIARKQTNLDIEFGGEDVQAKLLELAKSKAPDPDVFTDHPPYFYFAEISNDLMNCYYLEFQKAMLESWVDELKEGVQFQAFHQNSAPIGHSIYGWQDNKDGRERTIGAFYAIPGVQLNQYMSNDSFIAAIKSGSIRDVSVGMFVEDVECSICGGKDVMDFWGKWMGTADCEHWLGEQYPITDSKGKETGETVLCKGLVFSGDLNEVSSVFKGGAPMAGIVPAMQLSRSQGLLEPHLQDRLESRFGISGVGGKPVTFGGEASPAWLTPDKLAEMKAHAKAKTVSVKENGVTEPEETATVVEVKLEDSVTPKQLDRLKELEIDVSDADGNFDFGILLDSMTDKVIELIDEVKALKTDAEVGRDYKLQKIDDTVAAGIRAYGNDWNAETYKKMLERSTIDEIKMFEKDLVKAGDAKFANSEGANRKTGEGETPDDVTVETKNKKYNDPRFKS